MALEALAYLIDVKKYERGGASDVRGRQHFLSADVMIAGERDRRDPQACCISSHQHGPMLAVGDGVHQPRDLLAGDEGGPLLRPTRGAHLIAPGRGLTAKTERKRPCGSPESQSTTRCSRPW